MSGFRPGRPAGRPERDAIRNPPGAAPDGLVHELWRLSLLPALLVALLLAAPLAGLQLYQLHQMAAQADRATAQGIARASASGLRWGDGAAPHGLAEHNSARFALQGDSILSPDAGAHYFEAPIIGTAGGSGGSVRIDSLRDDVAAIWRTGLVGTCVLMLLCLAAAALAARRFALRTGRPFLEFADAVAPRHGQPVTTPVPVTGCHELRRLQRGFNAATAALRDSNADMRQQISCATLELESKNAALEAVNQSRARFLAAASHDLRQPLSALTLFSSALKLGETDPVRLSRITHIQECVDSLDQLFTSLLDLSRLESGEMHPALGDFALDTIFNQVSRTFRMGAEQRDLRLIVRKTDAWVHCDRLMLSRILNNLVSNAVRYTGSGGVLVGARQRRDRIRIDVWDTGPGIAPEHRERVFEEFFRGHDMPPASGERRGLGLGLATVRRLCDLLSVPIRLESRQARGTLFTIEIPLATGVRSKVACLPPERPLDVTGLRVLVIEDEPAILEGLQILLESWGCEVAVAACGEQAIQAAHDWPSPPDLVVSDLQLGGGHSGLEVIDALQRHYGKKGLGGFPSLLITGETKVERLREISAARIPVLYKPVTPAQLREAMVATIAVRKLAA